MQATEPFGLQFPKDLFQYFATKYISVKDLARVAQCTKSLNARVNALGSNFWTGEIMRDFPLERTSVTIKWLYKAKDPNLSKICYIAYKFWCWIDKDGIRDPCARDEPSVLALPVLSNYLMNYGIIKSQGFLRTWEAASETDKQIFYELIQNEPIDGIPGKIMIDFVNRGFCESILKKEDGEF